MSQFPIRTISEQTGVPTTTLRAWERRYGLLKPSRTAKGHRLYTHQDIELVKSVVSLLKQGHTISEAIRMINENMWGNGTAVFTNDGGAARKFQNEILVGMVGINVPIPVPLSFYSFGGWKESLFGDHDIYGPDAIRFYTQHKTVITRWPDPIHRGVDLGFPQHG